MKNSLIVFFVLLSFASSASASRLAIEQDSLWGEKNTVQELMLMYPKSAWSTIDYTGECLKRLKLYKKLASKNNINIISFKCEVAQSVEKSKQTVTQDIIDKFKRSQDTLGLPVFGFKLTMTKK